MTEYEARTTRPLKGYHLAEDRGAVIPGGALVTVTEHGGVLTATAYRPDGPYGINLDPNNPQIKPVTKAGKS